MTKSINTPPNPEPEKPKVWQRLLNKLKSSPKTVVAGVAAIAAVGSLGYWGTQVLAKKKLAPFLENQIGKIIERPLDLGELKGFSLNGVEFGQTVIPPTATDPDQVTVEGVKVGFNLIPVLFRRTLPLDVALIQPDIYLEQEQDGEWINLDFLKKDTEKKDPLVYFDVDLDVEQANITAVPYQQDPLKGKVDGSGRYNQKQALAEYDLDATIQQAKATIQGETKLETGSTDTRLLVEDLILADAARFLPIPVEINSGTLNADLDINIPSFDEITAANVKGKVNLQNLSGDATDLDAPISAESQLNFSGRNAEINQTQATLGDITAQVDGQVNLDSGYDLDVDVLPFQLASLPNKLTEGLPVDVAGIIEAQVQLRGAIKDPKLTGKIDNTQTLTIGQTAFQKLNADFRGDLEQVVLDDVQIIPVAGGKIMAAGKIETNLRQALESKQAISTKMPLALSFTADLPTQQLVNPYYQLPQQVVIGDFKAEGQINGTLNNPQGAVKWNIADSSARNLEDVAGSGELVIANQNIQLQDTEITYGEGKVDVAADANLSNKKWQASLDANSLNLRPFAAQFTNPNLDLDQPLAVDTAQAKLNGSLDRLGLDQIAGTVDLNLDVNGGDVVVDSQLNGGNIQAKATPSNIQLDPFIPSLPVTASLTGGTITTSGKVAQLLAFKDNPSLNSLKADADLDLIVDGEIVGVNSQVNSGKIQAQANTSQINLNRFASNLPIPANITSSQLTASGELRQLLTLADDSSLSTFVARVDANLNVAEGTVKAIANLNNNQWQANVNANNLSSQLLLDRFAPPNLAALQVDNINAQGNLAGDIRPLINQDTRIPVAVNQVTVDSGAQNLQAEGNLTLANITSKLDADSNLNVKANLDFDRLPIDQLVAANSQNNELIKESVNFRGKAAFNGQFNGQQLLSAPTENVSLIGDLNLQNFAFNDIVFDSIMTGKLNVQPQQEIALNLQGGQDIIAARAVPCNARRDCRLPYLPTSLEIRQGEDTEQPVIAVGRRNGDRFALDIDNFPLALLNVAPGKAAGIEGPISGTTTGEIDLNLYTLATTGNIQVAQPGLGYIQADQLNADFNYDPANSLAEVNSASLKLDRSQYDFNAALNLATGKIDGRLNIPQAYIQDALTTLNWFTVEDVMSLLQTPDYADPSAIRPAPEKDTVDQSIARKLNQLRRVNRQIQANAAIRQAGSIPTKLDIKGKYAGEIILGGTIQVPEADFRVEGNNWQWQPRQAYPDLVNPLGLVIEESQYIALPKLLIDGALQGTTVDLAEARIEVQEAILSLKGKLSAQQTDAKFAVANLTVDDIDSFVEIPVDLAGEINSIGTIKGTLEQPRLDGKVAFSNGAFNGNLLPAKVAGNFNYDGSKLGFKTTAPEEIQVEANLPYPIIPGKSDRFTAKANLESEAFIFLDAFSQNYLNWVGGEGDAQLEASARLDLNRAEKIYDLSAQGVVNLDDANVIVQTPFFTEPFQGTGKITVKNQIVNVETLDATFANKDLSAAGKFPILTPVRGLENPLTINLPEGDIEIDKLYQGGVEGQVIVTGASLKPVIGGEVTLADGKVSIPQTKTPTAGDAVQIGKSQAINAVSGVKTSSNKASRTAQSQNTAPKSVITTLNNLKVNLQDFKLQQTPLYDFQLKGGLTLNGTADEPNNIIPKGKLTLTKADVDLFSNTFKLARNRDNTIVFYPKAGVFNPVLDIILRTSVEDVQGGASNLRLAESNANEINDPLTQGDDSQTVRISLTVDGEAQEILPNLGQTASSNCDIRPSNQPFVKNQASYNQAELNRFTQCFGDNFSLYTQNNPGDVGSQRSLINSPAVALTSTPSLNQGEIVNLLSNQFVGFARDISSASQSELFDLGVQRFVVNPLLDSVLYRVEDTTVSWGKKIDLDYLTIYPDLEGTYQINQDSSIRFIYSHNLFTKLIETINSSGDEETSSSNEIKLEYQRNF